MQLSLVASFFSAHSRGSQNAAQFPMSATTAVLMSHLVSPVTEWLLSKSMAQTQWPAQARVIITFNCTTSVCLLIYARMWPHFVIQFLPRDTTLAQYMLSSCVRPSVGLSITNWHCTKMAKCKITQTTPYYRTGTLVF